VFTLGHRLASYSWGTTYFVQADCLGTERLRENVAGSSAETCTNQPFGDNQVCSGTETSPLHFTGKERDAETNLDYFGARNFNSAMARFTIPDWAAKPTAVPYASYGNPQTLNLYSYVKNDPTTTDDHDGHDSILDNTARMKGAKSQASVSQKHNVGCG